MESAVEAHPGTDLGLQKEFEVLLEALRDAYKEFADTAFKLNAAILIVLGWFGSTDNPLPLLCKDSAVKWAVSLTVLAGLIAGLMLWAIYGRAQNAFEALEKCGVKAQLFARYRVTLPMFLGGIVGLVIMFVGLIASILQKYSWTTEACASLASSS